MSISAKKTVSSFTAERPDYESLRMFKDERKVTYLNPEGADKPLKSPLPLSTIEAAREYRLGRFREQMAQHDCAAILLYDPINIKYAFDISNMQVWTAHNAVRYALIFQDGPAIMFEFKGAFHLCDDRPLITEVRKAVGWIYMGMGDRSEEYVRIWADEIADLIKQYGRGDLRLAVDKLEPPGLWALEVLGIICVEGQKLTESARAIKSSEEIELMRWTIQVCEAGMARIYENSLPGKTEQELWAELHYENARSGGEWLETRLLLCGDHTNPWYSECSDRLCNAGEMVSFDTDMIGPYGYCADLSRSWTCDHTRMTPKQAELYAKAVDQVEHNLALLAPGVGFAEFNEKSWQIPEKHQPYRYSLAAHGVGMADEWPVVLLHPDFEHNCSGEFEEGMVICVESLITETGAERLDTFPWEET